MREGQSNPHCRYTMMMMMMMMMMMNCHIYFWLDIVFVSCMQIINDCILYSIIVQPFFLISSSLLSLFYSLLIFLSSDGRLSQDLEQQQVSSVSSNLSDSSACPYSCFFKQFLFSQFSTSFFLCSSLLETFLFLLLPISAINLSLLLFVYSSSRRDVASIDSSMQ